MQELMSRPAAGLLRAPWDVRPREAFPLGEVLEGLRREKKGIAPKFFYDERGSQLFDAICGLPEYYPTRKEIQILRLYAKEMAECLGASPVLVELGSGSSMKTRLLLDRLKDPAAYVPIDISRKHLLRSAARLHGELPGLPIQPLCGDYLQLMDWPQGAILPEGPRCIFFPGSTIGNLDPDEASSLLRNMRRLAGRGCTLLLGVDLLKDPGVLVAAYNDSQGVTAAFNLNLLRRLNREMGGDFRLENFSHRAVFNAARERVEMHLVSLCRQSVRLGGEIFRFEQGETIHTENSHKFSHASLVPLLRSGGFIPLRRWTDPRSYFAVYLCRAD